MKAEHQKEPLEVAAREAGDAQTVVSNRHYKLSLRGCVLAWGCVEDPMPPTDCGQPKSSAETCVQSVTRLGKGLVKPTQSTSKLTG